MKKRELKNRILDLEEERDMLKVAFSELKAYFDRDLKTMEKAQEIISEQLKIDDRLNVLSSEFNAINNREYFGRLLYEKKIEWQKEQPYSDADVRSWENLESQERLMYRRMGECVARAGAGYFWKALNKVVIMTAPKLRALPKPAEVRVGQWWKYEACQVSRITHILPSVLGLEAIFEWLTDSFRNLLENSKWTYHGDGERPAMEE